MQFTLSPLAHKIKQKYSKDKIYDNSNLIYSMNKYLQFPITFIYSQFGSEKHQQILKAIKSIDFIKIINNQKVKLVYPGSNKIVLIKGIKKQVLEQKINFFIKNHGSKPKKQMIDSKRGVFEMETQDAANNLKKFMRYTKKKFDLNQNNDYKNDISTKIRIIIEGEELYTLLLDHLFDKEYRHFIMQQQNVFETYQLEPIIGFQMIDYSVKEESQSSISDITSRCSDGNSSKFFKELIQTNETGTQINESIALDNIKKNSMISLNPKQQDIFGDQQQQTFQPSLDKESEQILELQVISQVQDSTDLIKTPSQNQNIILSLNFQNQNKEEQQPVQQNNKPNIYTYEMIVDLYQTLIDQNCLPQPQILDNYPQILQTNESYSCFLDSIHQKVDLYTKLTKGMF